MGLVLHVAGVRGRRPSVVVPERASRGRVNEVALVVHELLVFIQLASLGARLQESTGEVESPLQPPGCVAAVEVSDDMPRPLIHFQFVPQLSELWVSEVLPRSIEGKSEHVVTCPSARNLGVQGGISVDCAKLPRAIAATHERQTRWVKVHHLREKSHLSVLVLRRHGEVEMRIARLHGPCDPTADQDEKVAPFPA